MAVHPDSKIGTWLNTWRPDVYTSLTDKENWTYINKAAQKAYWEDEFDRLNTALLGWQSADRSPLISQNLGALYQYLLVVGQFGIGGGSESLVYPDNIYTANGFFAATLSRAEDFYNTTLVDPWISSKITADVNQINGRAAQESSAWDALVTAASNAGRSFVNKCLFETPVQLVALGKPQMADLIYNDYGWLRVYQNLNVGSLTVPPGVL